MGLAPTEKFAPPVPTTDLGPTDAPVSDHDIGQAVKAVLAEAGGHLLLSALGLRLSLHLGRPLREVLGSRKLKKIIEEQLPREVRTSGDLSKVEVRLVAEEDTPHPRRYDQTFWAAFSKPIVPPNTVRGLNAERPYEFNDYETEAEIPSGWLPIAADAIPDRSLSKADRDPLVKEAIAFWCGKYSLNVRQFSLSGRDRVTPHRPEQTMSVDASRIGALRAFIDAIPEQERANYTLPLDLVRQFLD